MTYAKLLNFRNIVFKTFLKGNLCAITERLSE